MRTQLLTSILLTTIAACGGDPKKSPEEPQPVEKPVEAPADPPADAPADPPADPSAGSGAANSQGSADATAKQAVKPSADEIQSTIQKKYLAGMKACLTEQKKQDPNLKGKVTVMFTIGIDGKSTNNKASGINAAMEACVVDKMSKWTFPKPTDEDSQPAPMSLSLTFAML